MSEFMQRRVYGADHDDPDPGPQPGHEYRELVGGPLDGLLVDVTGWDAEEVVEGAALITEIGAYGPGGRAQYGPRNGDSAKWDWEGDTP
ncbi:hypothetical protein [Streptomyces sp. 8L]|uniref:hypothetical protein n=1 Tax=Streptomyces sp. 8L TaxID=2877242 RepID=UPI001CD36839|nr:hypothetical protein [Streptomyces sp. 8L]MCA1223393.1 hypothetical protein [Streptomyces sp. 8L]